MRATGMPTPRLILAPKGNASVGVSWAERLGALVILLVGTLIVAAFVGTLEAGEPVGVGAGVPVEAPFVVGVEEIPEDDDDPLSSTRVSSM